MFDAERRTQVSFLWGNILYLSLIVFIAGGRLDGFRIGRYILLFAGLAHGIWIVNSLTEGPSVKNKTSLFDQVNVYNKRRDLMPHMDDDFTEPSVRLLTNYFNRYNNSKIALLLDKRIPFPQTDAISLYQLQNGSSIKFIDPYFLIFNFMGWRGSSVDYIVVGVSEEDITSSFESSFCIHFSAVAQRLIVLWQKKELGSLGLKPMDEIELPGQKSRFLLIKVKKITRTIQKF